MVFFLINPGTSHPAVAFQSGIRYVCVDAFFLFQPVKVIIGIFLGLLPGDTGIAGAVKIAVVKLNIVETQIIPQWVYMHFPHTLAVVSCFGKFACHSVWIIPDNAILIAGSLVMFLGQTGVKSGSGGNAAWAGAVGIVKRNTPAGQCIQIRSFDIRMSGKAQTVPTKLVSHNQ